MTTRRLGKEGPDVFAIGLGCMGMSDFYGVRDDLESERALRLALDLGITLLDTADSYASGANEAFVGRCIQGRRDDVIIGTKFGHIRDANGAYRGVSGYPDYVREACHASLRRLGVDTIDLYFQHRVDPKVPIEETVGALARLVEEGKVRFIGLSEAGPRTIRRAHAVHPLSAVQSEYSLWSRDVEIEVLPVCRELGIGLVAYSPLGRGFLTGSLKSAEILPPDDYRRNTPRFQGENLRRNLVLVDKVECMARAKDCTPAQLALAWVLSRGTDIVPIPGTKRVRYLRENLAALDLALSPEDAAALDDAFPIGAASGERYNEWGMDLLDDQ
ncbi:MAG: aldo/keto reductase [Burkholderiaceae bacterium]|nr:aldo/keto reductase [Burkholderiaceae bacterium]